jgi:hypothetical protein
VHDGIHLPSIHVARYRFALNPLEPIPLPPNAGSTLRGGFGYVLKRMVCYRSDAKCEQCDLGNDCVYGYLFRTAPPDDAEVLSTLTAVTRPFVIEPPMERREVYTPEDRLAFHVALIGRGIAYLPYFVLGFQQLGNAGLGPQRGRFALQEVTALRGTEQASVFDVTDGTIREVDLAVDHAALEAQAQTLPTDRLDVAFLTPTRLKHRGELMWEGPPFHVLVRRLFDRISSLAYFHCGERWEIDFRGWIERAKEVRIADAATTWADWSRYSGRQDRRIKMGGLVGPVAYEGDLAPYRALLALGSLIHVGKGTVMGNGRMALKGLDKAGMM